LVVSDEPAADDLRMMIDDKAVYIETRLHHRLPVVPDESWRYRVERLRRTDRNPFSKFEADRRAL